MGVGAQRHAPTALPLGKRLVAHCSTGGWVGPALVWRDVENLAPTGIRSPTVQPVAQSLHRLRYPGPHKKEGIFHVI
jgi:hypothetical protein